MRAMKAAARVWDTQIGVAYTTEGINQEKILVIADGDIVKGDQALGRDYKVPCIQYFHRDTAPGLKEAGVDLRNMLEGLNKENLRARIILIAYSKAVIATFYAFQDSKPDWLEIITGGAPLKGTELCDWESLKKLPHRLPNWVTSRIFRLHNMKPVEKDLEPNSEIIRGMDIERLSQMVSWHFITVMFGTPRTFKGKTIDRFTSWLWKGHLVDGVLSKETQNMDAVKTTCLCGPHSEVISKIVKEVVEYYCLSV